MVSLARDNAPSTLLYMYSRAKIFSLNRQQFHNLAYRTVSQTAYVYAFSIFNNISVILRRPDQHFFQSCREEANELWISNISMDRYKYALPKDTNMMSVGFLIPDLLKKH